MAQLAQKRGFGQEAIRLYELALEYLPTYRPAWIGLADVLQQQGFSDASIADRLMCVANRLNQSHETDQADQMNQSHLSLEKESGLVLMQIRYALADCGAYKEALLLPGVSCPMFIFSR